MGRSELLQVQILYSRSQHQLQSPILQGKARNTRGLPPSASEHLSIMKSGSNPRRFPHPTVSNRKMDDPLATFCPFYEKGAVETTTHTLLECMAFSHIRNRFPEVTDNNTLQALLRKKQKTVLIATFLGKLMKERQ